MDYVGEEVFGFNQVRLPVIIDMENYVDSKLITHASTRTEKVVIDFFFYKFDLMEEIKKAYGKDT